MAKKKKTDEEIAQEAKDKNKKLAEAKAKYLKEADEKYKAFEEELNMTEEDLVIAKAKKRAEQLQAKILKLETDKETKNLRSKDTRQKILVGAFLKKDPTVWEKFIKNPDFIKFLERDIDRKLFEEEDTNTDKDTKIPATQNVETKQESTKPQSDEHTENI